MAKAVQVPKGSAHRAGGSWCHCLLIQPNPQSHLQPESPAPPGVSSFTHSTAPRFSHHHGAHKAAIHKQSGALAKWVLTSVPAPIPSLPHTDEACLCILCLDSGFQPICNHPSFTLAPALCACASIDSSVEVGMRGSRQGDKSPKEHSNNRKRRAEQHFISAPQHGCSLQTGAE